MSKISLRYCVHCGVPHVPRELADRVRAGESIEIEIVYGSGVAGNILKWGTGAINVDGCRVAINEAIDDPRLGGKGDWASDKMAKNVYGDYAGVRVGSSKKGRWPANVIHDGSEEVVEAFPDSKSCDSPSSAGCEGTILGGSRIQGAIYPGEDGSAARFFYTSKADSDDRIGSKHPTVKPLDLMQYLIRLVTPQRGTVVDPFAGTGTTGEAAWREGMGAILIEREVEYQADIRRRMALCLSGPDERARESIKAKLKDKPLDHGPLFGGTV